MGSALQKVESSEHEVMQSPAMMTHTKDDTKILSFSSESPWQCGKPLVKKMLMLNYF